MEPYIFLDFCDEDAYVAEILSRSLSEKGINVLTSREVASSGDYNSEITGAIEKSKAFVLIVSKNTPKNNWRIHSALECAFNRQRVIIPYVIGAKNVNKTVDFITKDSEYIYSENEYTGLETLAERCEQAILADKLKESNNVKNKDKNKEKAPKKKRINLAVALFLAVILAAGATVYWVYNYVNPSVTAAGEEESWDWKYYRSKKKLVVSGSGTFSGTDQLSEDSQLNGFVDEIKVIALENGITGLGSHAFYQMDKLEQVVLPTSLAEVAAGSFSECPLIKEISIPEGVMRLYGPAFSECESLEKIELPESLKMIFSHAPVKDCPKLKEIRVAGTDGAFISVDGNLYSSDGTKLIQYCAGRTDKHFDLPDNVAEIGEEAFRKASNLETIALPDSLKTIGLSAFESSGLKEISLPGGVSGISGSTFTNCTDLTNIEISGASDTYLSVDSILYSADGKTLIQYCIGRDDVHFDVPDGVETIGGGAFAYASKLETITFPDSLVSVGFDSFGFSGLTDAVFPDGFQSIDTYAFRCCEKLKKVTLNDDIKEIKTAAFYECPLLEEFEIPDGADVDPYYR